ncbi:MAG: hypothetical protein ACLTXM_10650 [Enterococcus sp.]
MYNYVWLAAGVCGILLIFFLVLLMKDLSFSERNQKIKWRYLLPDFGLLIVAVAWGMLAVNLFINIQHQLGK